jgi:hypothetical protein
MLSNAGVRMAPRPASWPLPKIQLHWFLPWMRPKVRRIVLRPYVDQRDIRRRLFYLAIFPALFLFCLVYGFFFAITAPYLIVAFSVPVVTLALLGIWALPELRTAPTTLMRFLFSGYIVALILWPNYLALALPGLPWITPARLTGFPLVFCLLICVSTSKPFKARLAEIFGSTPFVWKALAVFVAMQFLTILLSKEPATSFSKTLVMQVNWTTMFIMSGFVFAKPGRLQRYIPLICLMSIPLAAVAALEYKEQHLLWDGHIPSFLKVDDIDHLMKPEFRLGTNTYRAKATFSTALGLAEYMAILTPFFLHYAVTSGRMVTRLSSWLMIAVLYATIYFSGSRLGYMGMMVSALLYLLGWALLRWRRLRSDLLAPALVVSYPAFFLAVMGGSFFIHRIHVIVWGGGAQAGSNQARMNQIGMAWPNFLKNPIGHGTGMSGDAMGYGAGRFVTIDNYMISTALDYGAIGLIAYYGMFIAGIIYASMYIWNYLGKSRDPETGYLIPLSISVAAFLIINFVFSQQDLDPLLFILLGMIVALVHRLDVERKQLAGDVGRVALRRVV